MYSYTILAILFSYLHYMAVYICVYPSGKIIVKFKTDIDFPK